MLLRLPMPLQLHMPHTESTHSAAVLQLLCWTDSSLGGSSGGNLSTFCSEPRPAPSSLGNQGTTFLTQGAPAAGQL